MLFKLESLDHTILSGWDLARKYGVGKISEVALIIIMPKRDRCIMHYSRPLSCKKMSVSNYDELNKMEHSSGCLFSVEEELLDKIS